MFRSTIIIVICFVAFWNCSSTYIIDQSDSENNISKINFLSKTYTCLVQLNDGTEFFPGHGSSGKIGIERPKFEAFIARGWSKTLFGDVSWEI